MPDSSILKSSEFMKEENQEVMKCCVLVGGKCVRRRPVERASVEPPACSSVAGITVGQCKVVQTMGGGGRDAAHGQLGVEVLAAVTSSSATQHPDNLSSTPTCCNTPLRWQVDTRLTHKRKTKIVLSSTISGRKVVHELEVFSGSKTRVPLRHVPLSPGPVHSRSLT